MRIHEAAEQLGLSQRAIKYYENEGLLKVGRDENGYRNYTQQDLNQLKKISLYRRLGIAVKDIEDLLKNEDPSRRVNPDQKTKSAASGSHAAAGFGKISQ